MVPVTTTTSPATAPLRRTMRPAGTRPKAVIEIVSGPGVDTVSPPSNGHAKCLASSPSACANGASQLSFASRKASVSTKPAGVRALCGEIGEVHPQRFARDRVRRIVREKMHAFDDGVGGHDQIVARAFQDRRVVDEAKRAGIGRQRHKIARDQIVLAG